MGYSDWKEAALDFKTFVGSISNPEQREKVNQMREFMLEQKEEIFVLTEANSKLREEVTDLQNQLKDKNEMVFEAPYYWKVTENGEKHGPFCSKCFDADLKKIHLREGRKGYWMCPKCKDAVQDETYVESNDVYIGTSRIDFEGY